MRRLVIYLLLNILPFTAFAQKDMDEVLAQDFLRNGDYQKAADLYEDVYTKTGSESSYTNLINCLLKLKQFDKAEKISAKQVKRNPEVLRYLIDLGNIYKQSGNSSKSKEFFSKAINDIGPDMFTISEAGQKFYSIAEYDFAIQAFKKGRQVMGNESLFTYDLTRLYNLKQDKTAIIEETLLQLSANPTFISQSKSILSSSLQEKKDFETLQTILQKRISKDNQNPELADLMIWAYLQQKNFNLALEKAIVFNKALNEDGERILTVGESAANAEQYDIAIKSYGSIISLSPKSPLYSEAKMAFISVKNKKIIAGNYTQEDLLSLEKDYEQAIVEFGKTNETLYMVRELAHLKAYYLHKTNEAISLLEDAIKTPRISFSIQAQCKLDLGDIYVISGDVWEATLLYGQVDKSFRDNPMGQEARFRGARLSFWNGDFDWAKAQLDVLKASTSQLFANDALNLSLVISDNAGPDSTNKPLKMYAHADLEIFKNQLADARATLDSLKAQYPGHPLEDDILMAETTISLKKGLYSEAAKTLTEIIERFNYDIWGDDALFMLADLNEHHLNNKPKAQELYERLLTQFPGSLYVLEARKRFRALRGDIIN
ncbi:tetratricopeptide repeat protein [Solitalea sp. MAHUQ-68]|uniref:Tetratricopeptide repeat protein n=1 Tax=Solitalea agri TaxID=2953739 RepID=A0A9X2JDC3_9SPHI|nr:tetratricopeptide repeat protein [Solitalea agri]MCO4293469.1 tetratricopeptide repeat protein [Solitalea agri]